MMVGTVYFLFRPNAHLLGRLIRAPEGVRGALEEAAVMPARFAGEIVDSDTMAAAKILFVANITAATLPGSEVRSLFGSLEPTVAEFDKWWTCEVFANDLCLADVADDLRKAGALESLDPVVERLLRNLASVDGASVPCDPAMRARTLDRKRVVTMFESIFVDEDLHAKRMSRWPATRWVRWRRREPRSTRLARRTPRSPIKPRRGVKQVDRFLSNAGIDVEALTPAWARFVIASRKEIIIALDWTEFDADDHATLCAYVVTTHGRATPLCWKTHTRSTLTNGGRTDAEHALIERLSAAIPEDVSIALLADRGFGDQVLYQVLDLLGWHYVMRFRGVIAVEHAGVTKAAARWLPPSGRATKLAAARVTKKKTEVGAVVVVKAAKMKDAWCLATNLGAQTAAAVVKLYGRRFTIEETFRDQKDLASMTDHRKGVPSCEASVAWRRRPGSVESLSRSSIDGVVASPESSTREVLK